MNQDFKALLSQVVDLFIERLPQIGLALVSLIVGWWLISKAQRLLITVLKKKNVDESLHSFLGTLSSVLLKVVLLISVASMLGIETTSFVALIGAAGLAIGLALQGSLANFAGGILILVFKPFRVGDYIEAQGLGGSVREIQIFFTVLTSPDNKRLIIPNGALASGSVTNYSAEATRRIDLVFGIGYDDDIKKAKALFERVLSEDPRVLAEPASVVAVDELAESSVNFVVRPWVSSADYWAARFDLQEKIKLALDEAGISIPYPQRDLHFHSASNASLSSSIQSH